VTFDNRWYRIVGTRYNWDAKRTHYFVAEENCYQTAVSGCCRRLCCFVTEEDNRSGRCLSQGGELLVAFETSTITLPWQRNCLADCLHFQTGDGIPTQDRHCLSAGPAHCTHTHSGVRSPSATNSLPSHPQMSRGCVY